MVLPVCSSNNHNHNHIKWSQSHQMVTITITITITSNGAGGHAASPWGGRVRAAPSACPRRVLWGMPRSSSIQFIILTILLLLSFTEPPLQVSNSLQCCLSVAVTYQHQLASPHPLPLLCQLSHCLGHSHLFYVGAQLFSCGPQVGQHVAEVLLLGCISMPSSPMCLCTQTSINKSRNTLAVTHNLFMHATNMCSSLLPFHHCCQPIAVIQMIATTTTHE